MFELMQERIIIYFIVFMALINLFFFVNEKWYIPFLIGFSLGLIIVAIIIKLSLEVSLEEKVTFLENYLNIMRIKYEPERDFWEFFVNKVNTELIINEKTSLDDIIVRVETMYIDYLKAYYVVCIVQVCCYLIILFYCFWQ